MKISKEKKDRICEQILYFLFTKNPQPIFTAHIAKEIARDEEFIKKLMVELKNKNLVIEIKKNNLGVSFLRRIRWKLSKDAYLLYKEKQK